MYQKILKNLVPIIFFITLILGIMSRVNLLNNTDIWYDEAFTGLVVKEDLGGILSIIAQDRVHPPLYYLLLKGWVTVLGNSELTLKLFSLVFGITLIITAYVLLRKFINSKAALIASGIFSLSPFFIQYSIEARSYIMLALEVLIATIIFLKLYKQKFNSISELVKKVDFKYLLVISLIMLFTHYISIIFIGASITLLILKVYPRLEKSLWAGLILLLAIILGKGLVFSGNFKLIELSNLHTKWLEEAQPIEIGKILYSFLFGLDNQALARQEVFSFTFLNNLNPIFILIIVLTIVLTINEFKSKDIVKKIISKILFLNILLVTITSLAGLNLFLSRYLTFLGVVYITWISIYLSNINSKKLVSLGLVYLLLLSQVTWVNSNKRFNLSEIKAQIESNRVVTQTPFDYTVLKYYLDNNRNLYFLDSSEWQMKKTPWPFFKKSQIIDKTSSTDIIL